MFVNRRNFLALGAGAASALSAPSQNFRHRGYLGWITDLAHAEDTGAAWPSMRLDERLLQDYRETFAMMREVGFQDLCVWGLYVSRSWPVNIQSAVQPKRAKLVVSPYASPRGAGAGAQYTF